MCGAVVIEAFVRQAHAAVARVAEAIAVGVMVVLVLGGTPLAHASLTPEPYLDTAYNDALWNELLNNNWPTGYPTSGSYASAFLVESWAGLLPPLAQSASPLALPTVGQYSAGWKINRTSDTLWLQLSGAAGIPYTSSTVLGEDWCGVRTGQCNGIGAYSAASIPEAHLSDYRDFYLQPHEAQWYDCPGNSWSWMDGIALDPAGFSGSGTGCEARVVSALKAEYTAITSVGVGTLVPLNASRCSAVATSWLSSYGNGTVHWSGNCWIDVWREADNVGALVHSLPQLFSTQHWDIVSSATTPSEATGLANARSYLGGSSCSVKSEVDASLDPVNYAPPDGQNGPCGGPVKEPAPQTNGPSSCKPSIPDFSPLAVNASCVAGEPVDLATGNFFTGAVDVSLPGIGVPFTFVRSYNSADAGTGGPLGPGWTDDLNWTATVGTGGDVTIRAGSGQQLHFTDNSGSYTPDAGGRATLTTAGSGYKLVTHDQLAYVFNSTGQLTSETDRNGEGLTFSYDGSGNLASVTDSAGRSITFTTSGGLLTGISLPDGRSVSYGYTSGLLTSFTDLRGHTVDYTYDSGNRLATIVDQNGHTVISNTYDSGTGRVTQQTDARGHSSTFGWNPSTGTATYTDPNGHTWTQTYVNNTLRSQQDPLGNTTTYTYDSDLNLTGVKTPRGNTTSMTWDLNGNMLTRTAPSPLSYSESWTYDSKNDVTAYTDRRGNTTTYGFDGKGNLTSVTLPNPSGSGAGPQTVYGRDATTGLITSITDPRGKQTTLGYDTAGDLTSVTTSLGYVTTYGYDTSGRVTSKVDPRGNVTGANPADYTWTYGYDAADHLTSETDPLGDETQWAYDPVGNLESLTDANNNSTTYTYDDANNLLTVEAPDTSTTTYAYDNNGNLTSKTDANNHTTTYAYDNANHQTSVVKPGGETWTYTYNPDGRLATSVDANGNANHSGGTTTYGYDALDRVTSIGYSGTITPNVTFTYDGDGNRTKMTDGAGTVTYTYDSDNRLTGATRGSNTFGYGYDANSNLTSETYPDSTAISYTYTDDEQMASATANGNTTTYAYTPAGDLLTATLPTGNGYVETRTYDKADRLIGISNANSSFVLSAFSNTLDPVGNPTEVDQSGATTSTTTYGYDTLNRLTSACLQASCPNSGDPKTSWTYDGVGNRLTQTTTAGTINYTYNSDDQLTAAGSTNYSYDANGNETAAGSNAYSYDVANRVISAGAGSTTFTYSYDGDGRRLSSSDGTNTTNYFWDPAKTTPELDIEQNGSGSDLRTYLYGTGLISMTTGGSSPGTYYYHPDPLGSIANLTDSGGNPQWTYSYDAWGNATATQDATGAPSNPLQFTAGYADGTGLLHFGARQYDASTGRFLTTDPANLAQGSPYAYVDDQPTSATDLTGLGKSYQQSSGGDEGEGPRHPNDICWEHSVTRIGRIVVIVYECIDSETGERYLFAVSYEEPNEPPQESGWPGISIPVPPPSLPVLPLPLTQVPASGLSLGF